MKDRYIRRSVLKRVRELFESPPANSGLSQAYTVYDEDEWKAAVSRPPTLTPSYPCVYLLDAYQRPRPTALPMVTIEIFKTVQQSFELGNRKGRRSWVRAHVFGRSRGERDDLGTFIADNLGAAVPIYTYPTSGSTPVFDEYALVRDGIDLENNVLGDEGRQEGGLDLWQIVTFAIDTKT